MVRIAPLVKQTSREARVEIQVNNAERLLRPGMFIEAKIELGRHENALIVPEAALVQRDERRGVFLADRGVKKAKFVPVVEGISEKTGEGLLVEIVKPALSGEVITLGQHLLEDDTPIVVVQEKAAEAASPATGPAEAKAQQAKAEAKS